MRHCRRSDLPGLDSLESSAANPPADQLFRNCILELQPYGYYSPSLFCTTLGVGVPRPTSTPQQSIVEKGIGFGSWQGQATSGRIISHEPQRTYSKVAEGEGACPGRASQVCLAGLISVRAGTLAKDEPEAAPSVRPLIIIIIIHPQCCTAPANTFLVRSQNTTLHARECAKSRIGRPISWANPRIR